MAGGRCGYRSKFVRSPRSFRKRKKKGQTGRRVSKRRQLVVRGPLATDSAAQLGSLVVFPPVGELRTPPPRGPWLPPCHRPFRSACQDVKPLGSVVMTHHDLHLSSVPPERSFSARNGNVSSHLGKLNLSNSAQHTVLLLVSVIMARCTPDSICPGTGNRTPKQLNKNSASPAARQTDSNARPTTTRSICRPATPPSLPSPRPFHGAFVPSSRHGPAPTVSPYLSS